MSIISGNRRDRRSIRHHVWVDTMIHYAMSEPSKAELREMLTEAVRNTAAQEVRDEAI